MEIYLLLRKVAVNACTCTTRYATPFPSAGAKSKVLLPPSSWQDAKSEVVMIHTPDLKDEPKITSYQHCTLQHLVTRNTYPHINCLARTPRPHAQPGHVLTNYEYDRSLIAKCEFASVELR